MPTTLDSQGFLSRALGDVKQATTPKPPKPVQKVEDEWFDGPSGWSYNATKRYVRSPDGAEYDYHGKGLPTQDEFNMVVQGHAASQPKPSTIFKRATELAKVAGGVATNVMSGDYVEAAKTAQAGKGKAKSAVKSIVEQSVLQKPKPYDPNYPPIDPAHVSGENRDMNRVLSRAMADAGATATRAIGGVASSLNIPIPGTDRYLPTGDLLGGAVATPFAITESVGVLSDPDRTAQEKASAGVTLLLNTAVPVVVGKAFAMASPATRQMITTALSRSKNAALLERALIQAQKEGMDLSKLVEYTTVQEARIASQLPKSAPMTSGVAGSQRRAPKPQPKALPANASGAQYEVVPVGKPQAPLTKTSTAPKAVETVEPISPHEVGQPLYGQGESSFGQTVNFTTEGGKSSISIKHRWDTSENRGTALALSPEEQSFVDWAESLGGKDRTRAYRESPIGQNILKRARDADAALDHSPIQVGDEIVAQPLRSDSWHRGVVTEVTPEGAINANFDGLGERGVGQIRQRTKPKAVETPKVGIASAEIRQTLNDRLPATRQKIKVVDVSTYPGGRVRVEMRPTAEGGGFISIVGEGDSIESAFQDASAKALGIKAASKIKPTPPPTTPKAVETPKVGKEPWEGKPWYRGESGRSGVDKFYSTSKDIAGDYGPVSRLSRQPKNPLIVGSKHDLVDELGYKHGNPYSEPLNIPEAEKFDTLAKAHAQKGQYDSIIYRDGTFGEPELHLFGESAPTPPTTPKAVETPKVGKGKVVRVFRGAADDADDEIAGRFFTDNEREAKQYAGLAQLRKYLDENESAQDLVYEILAEEGADDITDLGLKEVRDILEVNGYKLPPELSAGKVTKADITVENPLDLRDVGYSIGGEKHLAEVWDDLHKRGLVDEAWGDIDEYAKDELVETYTHKASYRLFEGERVYDNAFKKGHDVVMFQDQGLSGKTVHDSYFVNPQRKPTTPPTTPKAVETPKVGKEAIRTAEETQALQDALSKKTGKEPKPGDPFTWDNEIRKLGGGMIGHDAPLKGPPNGVVVVPQREHLVTRLAVAYDGDGNPVGLMDWHGEHSRLAGTANIIVRPDARGTGVGFKLREAAEKNGWKITPESIGRSDFSVEGKRHLQSYLERTGKQPTPPTTPKGGETAYEVRKLGQGYEGMSAAEKAAAQKRLGVTPPKETPPVRETPTIPKTVTTPYGQKVIPQVSEDLKTPRGASTGNVGANRLKTEGVKGSTTPPRRVSQVSEPGATPGTSTKATGLANQVQEREALEKIIKEVEPTEGSGPKVWHEAGKEAVEKGADYEQLAREVGRGEVELTGERVGILLEGKRRLMNAVNDAAAKLRGNPGDTKLFKDLDEAEQRLQSYLEDVQAGKGRWSDAGRALQAGTTLDEANYAQVLEHLERGGKPSEVLKKRIETLTGKLADKDKTIADLSRKVAEARAEGVAQKGAKSSRVFDRTAIHKEIDDLLAEFGALRGGKGVTGGKQAGAVAKITAEDLKNLGQQGVLIGRIAYAHAKLGMASLEDVVRATQAIFKDKFDIDVDRQAVIDAMVPEGGKTRAQLQKDIAALRTQAKRESTANTAKIQSQIKDLEQQIKDRTYQAKKKGESTTSPEIQDLIKQRNELRVKAKRESAENLARIQKEIDDMRKQLDTGQFRTVTKREVELSNELETLLGERKAYAAEVNRIVRGHLTPARDKVVRELGGAIRGFVLGGDIGVVTRQGLFSWANPMVALKSTSAALKAATSEKALAKEMNLIRNRRVGGTLMLPVRKEHGLQLTDNLTAHEELTVLRWIRKGGEFIGKGIEKIPVWGAKQTGHFVGNVAGTLERFQLMWINKARAEAFDNAYKLGMRGRELDVRASFINNATGRGNIKQIPAALEFIATSPRYEATRWAMLWEVPKNAAIASGTTAKSLLTGKGLKGVNKGAALNIVNMTATAAELYGLYKLAEGAGYEVDLTPVRADGTRNPDFLKLRRGDEVWDVSAGLAPRLVDFLSLIAAIDDPDPKKAGQAALGRATTRAMSPTVRQPIEQASLKAQRNAGVSEENLRSIITGMPIDEREKNVFLAFLPLIVGTTQEAWTKDSDSIWPAASAGLKEFVGGSLNFYPKKR